MSEIQMDTMTQRLECLEWGSRGWKILGSAAVAVLGLTFFDADAMPVWIAP